MFPVLPAAIMMIIILVAKAPRQANVQGRIIMVFVFGVFSSVVRQVVFGDGIYLAENKW